MRKLKFSILLLSVTVSFLAGLRAVAQDDRAAMLGLVEKLKNADDGEKAASQLDELIKSKPTLRIPLIEQIRPVIRAGPEGGMAGWINSIKVSGDLRLVELAPDLAKWIDRPGSSFLGILPQYVENPAGTALVKMGDAALPALLHVAETGTKPQQFAAPMFIGWIGTPAARKALKGLIKKETDPKAKERLEICLKTANQPHKLE